MDDRPLETLLACLAARRTARGLRLAAADLRGARLPDLRADGLDLHEADLRDSVLAGARWRACTLRDSRLDGADLAGATLRLCILDDVRAGGARLAGSRLENCQARGARFDGADFTGAVLTDTDFSRASLRGAVLEHASATGADFRGADLRHARLRGADLTDADLRGADLTGADLDDAQLDGADLRGAIRAGAALAAGPAPGSSALPGVPDFPEELRALVETMAPIVAQVLRSAGAQGMMDEQTAHRLVDEAQRLAGPAPAVAPDTIGAVARILPRLGGDLLPALAQALRLPPGTEPPPEVRDTILALRTELRLGDGATAEDVLASLSRGRAAPGDDGRA